MPYGPSGGGTVTPDTLSGMGVVIDKGFISIPGEFPTPADVRNAWLYKIIADVTDDDPTKTNTGQSFLAGDEILWMAATSQWQIVGRAVVPLADTYKADVTPDGDKDGVNDIFTLPGGDTYIPTSIDVLLNGVSYNPASIVRMGPGYTQFQIINDTLPNASLGDELTCSYVKPA